MRIAIVDQHGNPGGGIRFVRALAEGLAETYPADEIGIFASAPVLAMDAMRELTTRHANITGLPLGEEDVSASWDAAGHEPEPLPDVNPLRAALRKVPALAWLYRRLRGLPEPPPPPPPAPPSDPSFRFTDDLIARLGGYDVIYLSWPFFIEPTDLPAPVVGTFHDFNFKHDFGNFTPENLATLERQVPEWLSRVSAAVVSTGFIGDELRRFYPEVAPETHVIPLATFVTSRPSADEIASVLEQRGLTGGYLLFPSNIARHKNLPGMFAAQALMKRAGLAMPLVICGWRTEIIAQRMRGEVPEANPYIDVLAGELRRSGLEVGRDIHLLGYVTDAEVDALVSGATLVVSPSRYEAGSGPGLDAWALGAPVALSGIPAHREQVELLGVDAWFFDESDPADIARVVAEAAAADNSAMVAHSAEALARYDWKAVAERYHAVFEQVIRQ